MSPFTSYELKRDLLQVYGDGKEKQTYGFHELQSH